MGREKSTELFSFQAKKCPCSAFMPENSGCCKDEHEIVSIEDSQTLSVISAQIQPVLFLIGGIYAEIDDQIIEQPITRFINPDFSPPPKEPLYQVNCSLVFYDYRVSA